MEPEFVLLVLILAGIVSSEDLSPVVKTTRGEIQGTVELTSDLSDAETFYAFRGIPYGTARRFEEAKPVSWNGTFNATEDGPACPQAQSYIKMSEDCLHLSVYVRASVFHENIRRPVLVYIHGGAFNEGSSLSEYDVGPHYIMEHKVVFVAINYRLNIFGFISTGTSEAPGNLGLKDQVLALKWVKENIGAFKGSHVVTLMGESAGSMAVTLHMVSPMSQQLFDRVILMSGSAVAQWDLPSDLKPLVRRTAKAVNCTEDDDKVVECLKQAPLRLLARAYKTLTDWEDYPTLTWTPVVERALGQQRFLDEDPALTLRRGDVTNFDVLAGMMQDEWSFAPVKFLQDPRLLRELNDRFESLAPICLLYQGGTVQSIAISQKLRKETFGNETIGVHTIDQVHQLFSEGIIKFGMYRTLNLLTIQKNTIYLYEMAFIGRYSHAYGRDGKPYGATHADDLYYLFTQSNIPRFVPGDTEWQMMRQLTKMWINFVKSGIPAPDEDDLVGYITWTPFGTSRQFLQIGTNNSPSMIVRDDTPDDRFKLWNDLFPWKVPVTEVSSAKGREWLFLALLFFSVLLIGLLMFEMVRHFHGHERRKICGIWI